MQLYKTTIQPGWSFRRHEDKDDADHGDDEDQMVIVTRHGVQYVARVWH